MREYSHEFAVRHGEKRILTEVNGREALLFADGAWMSTDYPDNWTRVDPPAAPEGSLPLRKLYRQTWLDRVRKDFADLKNSLLDPLRYGFNWDHRLYGDPPIKEGYQRETDWKAALKLLAALEKEHRTALAKLEAEYDALPVVREARRREAEYRAQCAQYDANKQAAMEREHAAIRRITLSEDAHANA